jgi:hypothetical protein
LAAGSSSDERVVVRDGETLVAMIFRREYRPERTEFVEGDELPFQVGYVVYPAGGVVAAHRHVPVERRLETTTEALFVKTGRALADFYGSDGGLLETHEIREGDFVLLLESGHGFRMQEDTVLIEIKQGPYFGADEKEYL